MGRYVCMNCGLFITKTMTNDPYMCNECEKLLEGAELEGRHAYPDLMM